MLAATLLGRWLPGSFEEFVALVFDAAVCLGTAIVCGYIVGRQRSEAKATVGVRVHVLVCVGAAGFVHLGMVAAIRFGDELDFARLIQSIATGIGFLGAGAIFKGGATVRGVNTATSIWLMGAAGTAAGCGAVLFALLISLIAYFLLRWSGEPVELDDLYDEFKEHVIDEFILRRPDRSTRPPTAPDQAHPSAGTDASEGDPGSAGSADATRP